MVLAGGDSILALGIPTDLLTLLMQRLLPWEASPTEPPEGGVGSQS